MGIVFFSRGSVEIVGSGVFFSAGGAEFSERRDGVQYGVVWTAAFSAG